MSGRWSGPRPLPDGPRLALVADLRSTWTRMNPHEDEMQPIDEYKDEVEHSMTFRDGVLKLW